MARCVGIHHCHWPHCCGLVCVPARWNCSVTVARQETSIKVRRGFGMKAQKPINAIRNVLTCNVGTGGDRDVYGTLGAKMFVVVDAQARLRDVN